MRSRGVRTECFSASSCLLQQKFELFQRSVQAKCYGELLVLCAGSTNSVLQSTGERLQAPALLAPALMTDDMIIQGDAVAASMSDPHERAELQGREIRSDIAAFKAANPHAEMQDFLSWRVGIEGLNLDVFPKEWLEMCWAEATAEAAADQPQQLFIPDREAEMVLHYLENIEGTQLLIELLRWFCTVHWKSCT